MTWELILLFVFQAQKQCEQSHSQFSSLVIGTLLVSVCLFKRPFQHHSSTVNDWYSLNLFLPVYIIFLINYKQHPAL